MLAGSEVTFSNKSCAVVALLTLITRRLTRACTAPEMLTRASALSNIATKNRFIVVLRKDLDWFAFKEF
jgi:hypothetical protein